jgi:hypothetical protein
MTDPAGEHKTAAHPNNQLSGVRRHPQVASNQDVETRVRPTKPRRAGHDPQGALGIHI